MSKIRVLIVDDSVVIRRVLSDVLGSDPDIEVAGAAANGRIALAKIPQVNPDLITLDIEMPELDGLETLKELRKTYANLPVIMFSTLTERGAEATLDALSFGASDYVTKPANVGKVSEAIDRLKSELVPKIKALVPKKGAVPQQVTPAAVKPIASTRTARRKQTDRIDIVCIGVSTGGPNALAEVIPALPADLPVPVLIVQHMPPVFTKNLADRLNGKSGLSVREGEAGGVVEAGVAWLAAGGHHMVCKRDGLKVLLELNDDPPENSCRPAVDVLFRSVRDVWGGGVLAVVLTGMGQDGMLGSECIRESGGVVFVQDEPTSIVWGMPGAVVQRGLADLVVPLSTVAHTIAARVARGRSASAASAAQGADVS